VIPNVVAGLFMRDGVGVAHKRYAEPRRSHLQLGMYMCTRTRMHRTSGRELPSPFPDTMHHWTPIKFATRRRRNSRRPENREKLAMGETKRTRVSLRRREWGRTILENSVRPLPRPSVEFPTRSGLWIISVGFASAICATQTELSSSTRVIWK